WVDRMAVIFPFEAPFYQRHGINATFVGHPLLETVKADKSREETLAKLGLDPQQPVIALLPGSRLAEISQHLPVMRDAAVRLRRGRRGPIFLLRRGALAAGG